MNFSRFLTARLSLPFVAFSLLVGVADFQKTHAQELAGVNEKKVALTRSAFENDRSLNFDVQVQLLAANDGASDKTASLPASLTPLAKHLRASLPFAKYQLVTTFLYRVENRGSVQVNGKGDWTGIGAANERVDTPIFYALNLDDLEPSNDAGGSFVRIRRFHIGLRTPILVGSSSSPNVQYQDTGLTTQISVRESEPTIVGTMNGAQGGKSYVVVLTVKRAN